MASLAARGSRVRAGAEPRACATSRCPDFPSRPPLQSSRVRLLEKDGNWELSCPSSPCVFNVASPWPPGLRAMPRPWDGNLGKCFLNGREGLYATHHRRRESNYVAQGVPRKSIFRMFPNLYH